MHIIFLNGSEFRGEWRNLRRALWSPPFVGLVLGMTAVIFLVQPYNHIMPERVTLRFLIVASCVFVFLALAIGLLAIGYRTCTRIRTVTVLFPAAIAAAVWGVEFSVFLGGQSLSPPQWAELFVFDLVLAIIGEVILSSFLLGRIASQTGMKTYPVPAIHAAEDSASDSADAPKGLLQVDKTASTADTQNWVELLGQRFACSSILQLKAEEHYVAVTLREGGQKLLRGRLSDAIAQLPEDAGKQVHRSYWVAQSEVAELLRLREGWRIKTHSGLDIPVARNRQAEVRDWVESSDPA